MKLGVKTYSSISSKGAYKNGIEFLSNTEQLDFYEFSKSLYKQLDIAYPKFYKMDELCKLAFLGTEILLSGTSLHSEDEGSDIAIVLANKHSSIASDHKHYESFKDRNNYYPSPAVFVYTLPNIMLGELCIRHQITGENSCFLMETPNADFLFKYVYDLFKSDHYKYCITGWVDHNAEAFESNLFLVKEITNHEAFKATFDEHFYNIIAKNNGEVN